MNTQVQGALGSVPSVAGLISSLNEDAREFFEERAAIREFDGGADRASAEFAAFHETCLKFDLVF